MKASRISPHAIGNSPAPPRPATLPFHLPHGSHSHGSGAPPAHRKTRQPPERPSKADTKSASYPNQASQSQIAEFFYSRGPSETKNNRSTAAAGADSSHEPAAAPFPPSPPRQNPNGFLCPHPTGAPPSRNDSCPQPQHEPHSKNPTSAQCHNSRDTKYRAALLSARSEERRVGR